MDAPFRPDATFVGVRRSLARRLVRLTLLVSLAASLCLLVYALFRNAPPTPVGMALTVVVCMLAALATPWKIVVRVGSDGIHVRSAVLPGSRFVPYARLSLVHVDGADVWLVLDDGERIGVGFGKKSAHTAQGLASAASAQLAATRAIDHPFAAVLARGGRAATEWLRALGGRTPDGAYRELAIPKSALLSTIEDAEAPPDIRLGAAVALRRIANDGLERARVRVAAQLTRDPKLRVGLDRAAADDEDALDEAIAAFCDEKRQS